MTPDWRQRLTLLASALGVAMLTLDNFVVQVALPHIGDEFHAGLSTLELTVSAYIFVLAVFPIAAGRLGDVFGRRRSFLAGLAIFTLASMACGAAPNDWTLIGARAVQGLGGAVMYPATLSLLTQAYPEGRQRAFALGVWSAVGGVGLVAGPVLGGVIVEGLGWRWVFYVNVPVGVLAAALTLWAVQESRDERAPRRVDLGGLLLLAAGLGFPTWALIHANDYGWASARLLGMLGGGALLLVAWVQVERRVTAPLVPLELVADRAFAAIQVTSFLYSAAAFGVQAYMSLLMQNTWGYSPLLAGLLYLPSTVTYVVLAPSVGRLAGRAGPRVRWMLVGGCLLIVLSYLYMAAMTPESRFVDGLLGPMLLRGVGLAFLVAPVAVVAMDSAPRRFSGLSAGVLTMTRQTGVVLGIALLGAAYQTRAAGAVPPAARDSVLSFLTEAPEVTRQVAARAVNAGYVALALAAAVLALAAAVAALAVRSGRYAREAPGTGPEAAVVAD